MSEIVSSMRDESSAEASKVGRREVESEPEPSRASPPGTKLSPLTDEPATDDPSLSDRRGTCLAGVLATALARLTGG